MTAAPTGEDARTLARSAVEARLAASAQIVGPVETVFWHLGELGGGEEWQVLLRVTVEGYAALEEHLVNEHPWDNPEVTALPFTHAAPAYVAWIQRATTAHQA
ncbi:divalent-cation tolerance protein CutA [Catenuloplanes sp. NPDC051500]|uniref:divalent-cation tolerance protein CutA n=1 Tax=Catenuloplanes sp. NPDC051500 TaxID=3363959 RepID=UPI0037BDB767